MKKVWNIGWFVVVLLALVTLVLPVQAADVTVKYSGPSGQGNIIYWAPSTGVTNLEMGADGIVRMSLVTGMVITNPIMFGSTVKITGATTIAGAVVVSNTVSATGFKIGTELGKTLVVTNMYMDDANVMRSNILWYSGGSLTNHATNP